MDVKEVKLKFIPIPGSNKEYYTLFNVWYPQLEGCESCDSKGQRRTLYIEYRPGMGVRQFAVKYVYCGDCADSKARDLNRERECGEDNPTQQKDCRLHKEKAEGDTIDDNLTRGEEIP